MAALSLLIFTHVPVVSSRRDMALDSEEHTATLAGTEWLGRAIERKVRVLANLLALYRATASTEIVTERQVGHPIDTRTLCGRVRPRPNTLYELRFSFS
jgi:hypothetical protein